MIIKLNKTDVEKCFDDTTDQTEVLVRIYKLVYPNWDDIDKIGDDTMSWPACNSETWRAICVLFMKFDAQHTPGCLKGGLWFNNGFSRDNDVPDWNVKQAPYTLAVTL